MTHHLRTVAIVVLAVGLVVFFLLGVNLEEVWGEMRGGHTGFLLLASLMQALLYLLRALRWRLLLRPIGRVRYGIALRATMIGFGLSAMLPARPGEVARAYVLARRVGFSTTATFATIIFERLLDLITVLLLFGAFLTFFDPGVEHLNARVLTALKVGATVSGAASLIALWAAFTIAGRPGALNWIFGPLSRLLPRRAAEIVDGLAAKVASGLSVVRQPGVLVGALVVSIILWLTIAVGAWAAVSAYRLAIPFTGTFLLLALLLVGVAVPTPGAVGGFHAAFYLGLTAFYGASPDSAAAAAIVFHALSFIPVALVGLILMAQEGMTFASVRHAAAGKNAERS